MRNYLAFFVVLVFFLPLFNPIGYGCLQPTEKLDNLIGFKNESFIENKFNQTVSCEENKFYNDEINPNLGYDTDRMMVFDEYRGGVYEKHPEYHKNYLTNHSCYSFHKDYGEYNDYLGYHEQLIERYNERNNYNTDNSLSERPDFENGTTWYVDDVPGHGPGNPPEDFLSVHSAYEADNVKDGDTVYVYNGYYQDILNIDDKSIIIEGEDRNNTILDGGGKSCWIWDSLIKFNVSTLQISSQVQSAYLNIYYCNYFTTDPVGRSLSLYRATSSWNENEVTWNNQPSYCSSPTSHSIVPSAFGWMKWDVTKDILGYINGSISNNGWKITDEHFWGHFDIPETIFFSKEYELSSYHPYLEINIASNEQQSFTTNNFNDVENKIIFHPTDDSYIKKYPSDINLGSYEYLQVRNAFGERHNVVEVYVDWVKICDFRIENGSNGIYCSSNNNVFEENMIINNTNGISLINSNNNLVRKNHFEKNEVDGLGLSYNSNHNIITKNNCIDNMKGISVRTSADNIINNNFCGRNHQGILINNALSTKIKNNNFSFNNIGIYCYKSYINLIKGNIIDHNSHKGIILRQFSIFNNISYNRIGPWNYQGVYIEKSLFNNIHHNNITENNDDGIGLIQTFFNRIHHNNIVNNTNYGIEGGFCLDSAINNYWGHKPTRWIFNGEDADIFTPVGFVVIHPYLDMPVNIGG